MGCLLVLTLSDSTATVFNVGIETDVVQLHLDKFHMCEDFSFQWSAVAKITPASVPSSHGNLLVWIDLYWCCHKVSALPRL